MINEIINGIYEKLNNTFGHGYEIYAEKIMQGFKEPCFFISVLNPTSTQIRGNKYYRSNLVCIQYFSSSNEPKSECYQVQEDLYLALQYIAIDGKLQRGIGMHGEYNDGVLSFFVNYNMFIVMSEEQEKMETLELQKLKMKGMVYNGNS